MSIKAKFRSVALALSMVFIALALPCNVAGASSAQNAVVDLVSDVIVRENIVSNRGLTYAYSKLNHSKNGWQGEYGLFNIASPKDSPGAPGYVIWKVRPGKGQNVSMEIDFKKWAGVGNGGVTGDGKPKLAFYYTTDESLAANGNPQGWTKFGQDVKWDINTYNYTVTTNDPMKDDGYVYIMMYCVSTGDGAWVDGVTFTLVDDGTKNVKGVTFEQKNISIPVGFLEKLNLVFFPKDAADQRVSWKSSDPSIVSVDNGVLKAVGVGDATVTITTMDGGLTAQCAVTVTKDPAISLLDGSVVDTDILNTVKNPYGLPGACMTFTGEGQSTPKVVKWGSVSFRDFGSNASAVYKLSVPAGESAVMDLSMVVGYADKSGILDGVVGLGNERESPRLNIFYTTSPLYHNDPNSAEWTRVDADSDWSGKVADYSFTVAPVADTQRDVYVMIVNTFISGQGAWIKSLSFRSSAVEEVGLVIKPSTKVSYVPGEKFDPAGMVVGIKHSDGTIAYLNANEYTVRVPDLSKEGSARIVVETKDKRLSGGFDILIANADATLPEEGAGSQKQKSSTSAMLYGAEGLAQSGAPAIDTDDANMAVGNAMVIGIVSIICVAALAVLIKGKKSGRSSQNEQQ